MYKNNVEVSHIRILYIYEFKLDKNAAAEPRNINKAFVDDVVRERVLQRWLQTILI